MSLADKTNAEFIAYLNRVADDYEESGSQATAEDYREAARRIELLPEERDPTSGLGDNQKAFLRRLRSIGPEQPRAKLWIGVADSLVARGLVLRLGTGATVRHSYTLTQLGRDTLI